MVISNLLLWIFSIKMRKTVIFFDVRIYHGGIYLFFFSVALCLIYCSSNLEKRVCSFLEQSYRLGFIFKLCFLEASYFMRHLTCSWYAMVFTLITAGLGCSQLLARETMHKDKWSSIFSFQVSWVLICGFLYYVIFPIFSFVINKKLQKI